MNNDWITDRLPTEQDAYGLMVWAMGSGQVVMADIKNIREGMSWMPITPPEPYVKPNRWTAEYNYEFGCWRILDSHDGLYVTQRHLKLNNDEHRKAAERIAEIYEEVLP